MTKSPALVIVAALLIASTSLSMASENGAIAPTFRGTDRPHALVAPTILSERAALDPSELVKYRRMTSQSPALAHSATAGASNTTKIVLISVGVGVLVFGVAVLVATHGGKTAYSGSGTF